MDAPDDENTQYKLLLANMRERFTRLLAEYGTLFRTGTEELHGLYDLFLKSLPPERRQHYNCHRCRHFVESIGTLVALDDEGCRIPVFAWDSVDPPPFFRDAVASVCRVVRLSEVVGVQVFGAEQQGERENLDGQGRRWMHLSATVPADKVWCHPLKSASDRSAELRQDFELLSRSLPMYDVHVIEQAVKMLAAGTLYRSEKSLGMARWLLNLKKSTAQTKGAVMRNLLWRAVATAPAGFAHFKNSVLGPLLDDINAGANYVTIERNWRAKLDPTQYQRPSALPSTGNVKRAEEIVEKLASSGALARRYARLEEVQAIWRERPTEKLPFVGGVFGEVPTREHSTSRSDITMPAIAMTWVKFRDQILPLACAIEFKPLPGPDSYAALVTAENPEAPPILQWDRDGARNPFSWYVHSRGSMPDQWGLQPGQWRQVTAVVLQPSMWNGGATRHGQSVFFLLADCRDKRPASLCLFPEMLRAEYHEVRQTIEAYSSVKKLGGHDQATACGLQVADRSAARWSYAFRVMTELGSQIYVLDRWD